MKYSFGRIKGEIRSHRVIIKKNKSNQTLNFSLYNCDIELNILKRHFKDILVKNKNKYFQFDIKFIEDWSINRRLLSHSVTVQDTRFNPRKSFTIGCYLHDFDTDEIRDVLMKIFCDSGGSKNGKTGK